MSKTAQLEEKLDGLVSLFKAGGQPSMIATDIHELATGVDATATGIHATAATSDQYSSIRTNTTTASHGPTEGPVDGISNNSLLYPTVSTGNTISTLGAAEPSPIEAEECLTVFNTTQLHYFPFVYIPPTTTAQQLRQERPFLWLCIMAITSRSTSQQQALDTKIKHTLMQRMLFEFERNVDLLLGLLAYIGWYGVFDPNRRIGF